LTPTGLRAGVAADREINKISIGRPSAPKRQSSAGWFYTKTRLTDRDAFDVPLLFADRLERYFTLSSALWTRPPCDHSASQDSDVASAGAPHLLSRRRRTPVRVTNEDQRPTFT
jgi:hypothetical protein